MWSSVKKIIEFVAVAVAATGVMILITFLQKYHYTRECLRCSLTESYEIPYHVWIQWKGSYKCSGTVIHSKYILTVADCVLRSIPNDEYKTELKVFSLSRTLNSGISHDVEKIIVHPSYESFNQHNVALLRLTKGVYGYTGNEIAISLSEKRPTSHEGLEMFVTGYGQISSTNPFADYDQHKFHMEIVSMKRCKKLFSGDDLSGRFCAIAASGYKPCMSDIGSPATVNKKHLIGMYIGFKKCSKNRAELYIDVTSYSDFIKSAMTTT